MRKILAGMLAGAMILGTLTGCSGGQETTGAAADKTAAETAGKEEVGKRRCKDPGCSLVQRWKRRRVLYAPGRGVYGTSSGY